jgi:ubiquinone/menaquinone biosynthesis C-methylase UbiE
MNKAHPWVESERKFYKKYFEELTKKLNLDSNLIILDYGASTGGFSSLLAEYNPHLKIKAVDSNSEAIKLAKEHYSHLSNLKFEVLNEIPKGNYDLIFYNLVLHELNGKGDKQTINYFLKKSYKNLKKGGKIFILDTRKISKKDFKELYKNNKNPHKGTFDEEYLEHNRFTLEDWKNMIESAGFETEYQEKLQSNLFKYLGVKK